MNWDKILPWRTNYKNQGEDSKDERKVISGEGPERIIINESQQDKDDDAPLVPIVNEPEPDDKSAAAGGPTD
jgi:hypothetical protein